MSLKLFKGKHVQVTVSNRIYIGRALQIGPYSSRRSIFFVSDLLNFIKSLLITLPRVQTPSHLLLQRNGLYPFNRPELARCSASKILGRVQNNLDVETPRLTLSEQRRELLNNSAMVGCGRLIMN